VTREDRIEALSITTADLLEQLNELIALREQVRQAQAAARQLNIKKSGRFLKIKCRPPLDVH
jgi:hypothetical protein